MKHTQKEVQEFMAQVAQDRNANCALLVLFDGVNAQITFVGDESHAQHLSLALRKLADENDRSPMTNTEEQRNE